jgi:hypothetical protein
VDQRHRKRKLSRGQPTAGAASRTAHSKKPGVDCKSGIYIYIYIIMSSRDLRSRSLAVDSKVGRIQGNVQDSRSIGVSEETEE